MHEKRALLLFIDLCAGIDFSSDDIYPHFLFAFRAIHRETKRQCILINLCFRLIVANRAINPYRFCGTFICQTVCSFFGAAFYYKHLRFCLLRTQCTHILIYVSIENRTTRHNAPCPGRIGAGQGTRGDAAIHLDDGIAPLPLQQTFGSSDLLVAAGQIDLPTATGVYRHQQQLRNLGQVRQGRFHRRFGVEYQPGLHPGGADGPPGIS